MCFIDYEGTTTIKLQIQGQKLERSQNVITQPHLLNDFLSPLSGLGKPFSTCVCLCRRLLTGVPLEILCVWGVQLSWMQSYFSQPERQRGQDQHPAERNTTSLLRPQVKTIEKMHLKCFPCITVNNSKCVYVCVCCIEVVK